VIIQFYAFCFIAAALVKRSLQDEKMAAGARLHLLERLNAMTDAHFTSEMLALVDPMSDLELEIYREAKSLDPPRPNSKAEFLFSRCRSSFDVLTGPAFKHFLRLNAGMQKAVDLCEAPRSPATTTAPAELVPVSERSGGDVPPGPPTQTAGLDEYRLRFEQRPSGYAIGSPGHHAGEINPHTGR
jgi:hypothetical protein